MRVLMTMLFLAAMPFATSAAQSQGSRADQRGDNRRDPCTLPEGGIRRGAPAEARARVESNGEQGKKEGLNRDNSVNCAPTPPPPPPPPPPSSSTGGEISGMSYHDQNVSFTWDEGEPGLSGWVIELYDGNLTLVTSATTDGEGKYSFTSVAAGLYVVCQQPQIGWWQSEPADGAECPSGLIGHIADVTDGAKLSGNFGNVQQ